MSPYVFTSEDDEGVRWEWRSPSEACERGAGFTRTGEGFRTWCETHSEYHIEPLGRVDDG